MIQQKMSQQNTRDSRKENQMPKFVSFVISQNIFLANRFMAAGLNNIRQQNVDKRKFDIFTLREL